MAAMVVAPTLRSSRSLPTPLGQDILMAALIADFVTLLAVSVVALVLVVRVGADVQLLAFPLFIVLVIAAFAGLRSATLVVAGSVRPVLRPS